MLRANRGLRDTAAGALSIDEAATAIVGYFYSEAADPLTKEPQCALIRFYKTSAFADLNPSLQDYARSRVSGSELDPSTKVMRLVATVGAEPEWCDPMRSRDHRAIPLPSVAIVEQAPMIAGLIRAIGLEIADVVTPPIELMQDKHGKTYNIFHVENALGSPFIPAQEEFVKPYGIKSVIGFGGVLPGGDFFAVVMFSRVRVTAEPASRFRSIALDVKAILHPFESSRTSHA